MSKSGPPYTPADLYLKTQGLKPCVIARAPRMYAGPHLFWIPPSTYERLVQRIQVTQPARNGLIRYSYNLNSIQYTLTGWTGNGGVVELADAAVGMGSFIPQFGDTDRLFYFSFPWRNLVDRPVYIDSFKDSGDVSTSPYIFSYEIHLQELPPAAPAATVASKVTIAPSGSAGAQTVTGALP